jgi:hypothetical protein
MPRAVPAFPDGSHGCRDRLFLPRLTRAFSIHVVTCVAMLPGGLV